MKGISGCSLCPNFLHSMWFNKKMEYLLVLSSLSPSCLSCWMHFFLGMLNGGLSTSAIVDESWVGERACWPLAILSRDSAAPQTVEESPNQDEDSASTTSDSGRLKPTSIEFALIFVVQSAPRVSGVLRMGAANLWSKTGEPVESVDVYAALPPLTDDLVLDSPLPTDDWGLPLALFTRVIVRFPPLQKSLFLLFLVLPLPALRPTPRVGYASSQSKSTKHRYRLKPTSNRWEASSGIFVWNYKSPLGAEYAFSRGDCEYSALPLGGEVGWSGGSGWRRGGFLHRRRCGTRWAASTPIKWRFVTTFSKRHLEVTSIIPSRIAMESQFVCVRPHQRREVGCAIFPYP